MYCTSYLVYIEKEKNNKEFSVKKNRIFMKRNLRHGICLNLSVSKDICELLFEDIF